MSTSELQQIQTLFSVLTIYGLVLLLLPILVEYVPVTFPISKLDPYTVQ